MQNTEIILSSRVLYYPTQVEKDITEHDPVYTHNWTLSSK